MAKFDAGEVIAVTAIKQLIGEWTREVDTNGGRAIIEADLLTHDCRCKLLDQ